MLNKNVIIVGLTIFLMSNIATNVLPVNAQVDKIQEARQKAAATNATTGVTSSNLTLGTPHLIGTEYLKTTDRKSTRLNSSHRT